MKLLLFLATPLFLIENRFKGHLNNLHTCVGNKQKLCVCDCGDVCAHFNQMHPTLHRQAKQNICASV